MLCFLATASNKQLNLSHFTVCKHHVLQIICERSFFPVIKLAFQTQLKIPPEQVWQDRCELLTMSSKIGESKANTKFPISRRPR